MGLAGLFGRGHSGYVLDAPTWREVAMLPVFQGLSEDDRKRLERVAAELVRSRQYSGAGGMELANAHVTTIAAFAALPVLELGPSAYGDWVEVVVYPGAFMYESQEMDELGIVHPVRHPRSGEAMAGGPLVLSWDDVWMSGGGEGYNVVIHEFAHKLDMANGAVDGLPVLGAGMSQATWAETLGAAYRDFTHRVDASEPLEIDPYGAESPAEFFAVLTEYFFEAPGVLKSAYPAVYEQLRLYYRQDPFRRMEYHDDADS